MLRADVSEAVNNLIAHAGGKPASWGLYEYAKRSLSYVCGWDAGAKYDQAQYDRAIRIVCHAYGL